MIKKVLAIAATGVILTGATAYAAKTDSFNFQLNPNSSAFSTTSKKTNEYGYATIKTTTITGSGNPGIRYKVYDEDGSKAISQESSTVKKENKTVNPVYNSTPDDDDVSRLYGKQSVSSTSPMKYSGTWYN